MTFIYYLSGVLLVMMLLLLAVGFIGLLIKPEPIGKGATKPASRFQIAAMGIVSMAVVFFGLGGIMAATEPDGTAKNAAEKKALQLQNEQRAKQAAEHERLRQIEAEKPKISTESTKEVAAFEVIEKNDGGVPLGERRVITEGVNGERTITYTVTRVRGKETERKVVKDEITKQPVHKVVAVGTYVKPKPVPAKPKTQTAPSQSVPAQSSGASAKCRDGTLSYSQNRRGTCSHHGGVSIWY